MLEGLEVTSVKFSELRWDNENFRVDAEFHQKTYQITIDTIKRLPSYQFKEVQPSILHPMEIKRDYVDEDGVWFFRTQNLRPLSIEHSSDVFISSTDAKTLSRNRIRKGDVLITRTGANFGDTALFELDEEPVASSHVFIVRTKVINPALLAVFLNTSYGRLQINKGAYGAAQPEIAPYYLRNIWIPKFSQKFAFLIEDQLNTSRKQKTESTKRIAEAEQALLGELGLLNWNLAEPLTFHRRANDVFAAGRLDSEHFKPKHVALESHIVNTRQHELLGKLLIVNQRGKQPEYVEEGGIPVVNSKHVNKGEVKINDDNRLGAPSNNRSPVIQYGDVLINGTGVGTIGRAAPYLYNTNALPDNHVTILRPKPGKIDPVYLSVFLNSVAGQLQVEKWLRGSSGQIEIYPDDLAQFVIWVAPKPIQDKVKNKVEDAYHLKRRSIVLLEQAKRAVEIAIEDSESAAMAYLTTERY